MSYQVLARKWRPRKFKEMVGQAHVLQALVNALDQNRLHHAYLFTGTRGVGKTTIARIFAKCLNCESGVSAQPCGQCSICNQVDAGNFIDLIEVDAASRTRVEDTRELLDNVQYAPSVGRYKVYLIDEVHMLSGHSFNALLKTLEEPPPHVKFLLATTDPQKLPVTVLSRCLQFNLKAMTPDRIVGHLKNVLEQEVIGFDEAALWELARGANGSMRDALSLTDQAIAYGNGTLRTDEVRTMLGTVDRSAVLVLLQRLAEGNAEALLQAVSQLSEQCPDYNDILAELITLLHRLTIAQAVPGYKDDNEEASTEADVLARLAGELTAEDVQLFYQVALMGRKDMPYVPDARRGLEMVLLRMLLFRPHSMGGGSSSVNPGSSEQATAKGLQSARENLGLKATTGAGETVKKKLICPPSAKNGNQNTPVEGLPVAGRQSIEATAQSRAADQIRPQALASAEDQISAESTQWDQLLPHLALSGAALNLARNCSKNEPAESEDTYHFIIDKQHTILLQPAREAMIKQALVDYIGRPVRFKIEVGESATNTPQQLQDKQQRQQQASAEQSIIENPGIKALIDQFDARIEAGSIKPRLLH